MAQIEEKVVELQVTQLVSLVVALVVTSIPEPLLEPQEAQVLMLVETLFIVQIGVLGVTLDTLARGLTLVVAPATALLEAQVVTLALAQTVAPTLMALILTQEKVRVTRLVIPRRKALTGALDMALVATLVVVLPVSPAMRLAVARHLRAPALEMEIAIEATPDRLAVATALSAAQEVVAVLTVGGTEVPVAPLVVALVETTAFALEAALVTTSVVVLAVVPSAEPLEGIH
jgi:hypothetical protein